MKVKALIAGSVLAIAAQQSYAATISVEVVNLSHGSYFTPLLLAAHPDAMHLFELGSEASAELQTMAESGDISGLETTVSSVGGSAVANPAAGLLAPGASVSVSDWDTGANTHLSITAMILPTNDGFIGLDAWEIPSEAGTYTLWLNGYDAGTEANDEIVNGAAGVGEPGIPANPGMDGGQNASGVTVDETNTSVHIHRGVLGDTDPSGGSSDIDSRIHRWLNPIAKVVVTVQ